MVSSTGRQPTVASGYTSTANAVRASEPDHDPGTSGVELYVLVMRSRNVGVTDMQQMTLFESEEQGSVEVVINDQRQHKLTIRPILLPAANVFVSTHHRHHKPLKIHKFSIAVMDEDNRMRGIAILGRPVARLYDDGLTIEVLRVATDGCANACSALYGASRRIAKEFGYTRLITYTLMSEPGTSLKAAGWRIDATNVGGNVWNNNSRNDGRKRTDVTLGQKKIRWRGI